MRKEKGGKRGRKKMDEREKESQVEERSEVITEEGSERREEEEIQEDPAIGEAVAVNANSTYSLEQDLNARH